MAGRSVTMRRGRLRCAVLATAACIAIVPAVVLASSSSAASTAVASFKISDAIDKPVVSTGDTFFNQDFYVQSSDGNVVIAGSADGSGKFYVDDILGFTVTRPDGTVATGSVDDSNSCSADSVLVSPPLSLKPYLQSGVNMIHLNFKDACGGDYGNSELYFSGNAAFRTSPFPPALTVVASPQYTVVRYVAGFNVPDCVLNLSLNGIPRGATDEGTKEGIRGVLCSFLEDSSNPAPPDNLSGTARLSTFIASRQYRGYTNIPSYTLKCKDGHINDFGVTNTSAAGFSWSLGYTRVNTHTPYGSRFSIAERYSDAAYDLPAPTFIQASDRTAVTVVFNAASRIARTERLVNYRLSGFDAPFIWDTISVVLGCDGTRVATVINSYFPSTVVYVNGLAVTHDKQSSDISSFILQGGTSLQPNGQGKLAMPCHGIRFNGENMSQTFNPCGGA